MEKLGERIGLYDIWVVFFPGIIGLFEAVFFMGVSWSLYRRRSIVAMLKLIVPNSISIWILIMIASYFIGIILQETGRWLRKKLKTLNIADIFLNTKPGGFSKREMVFLKDYLINNGWDGKSNPISKAVFHRINTEAQENEVAARYVKLSVLQNMSLSLAAAMIYGAISSLVLTIISIINGRGRIVFLMAVIGVVCIILMIMFFRRSMRFYRYWVRNIVYGMSVRADRTEKSKR